jgi:pimeloyl-ACP methyl ester carboxylesterase
MWRAESGPGTRVLLLVHGCLACAEQYTPLIHKLRPHYRRVWVVDLPGFGVAPALALPGLEACLAWLARALVSLAVLEGQAVDAVGHSFGAFLLQASLHAHPGAQPAVRKLVLASLGSLHSHLHLGWLDMWRTVWWATFFKHRLLGGAVRCVARYAPQLLLLLPADLHLWVGSERGETLVSECVDVRRWHCAWLRPAAATIAALRLPVALIWGEEDGLFPHEQARRFAAAQNLPLLSLAGCGHQPLLAPEGAALVRLALLRATC